jgi:dienelactone hydrolase
MGRETETVWRLSFHSIYMFKLLHILVALLLLSLAQACRRGKADSDLPPGMTPEISSVQQTHEVHLRSMSVSESLEGILTLPEGEPPHPVSLFLAAERGKSDSSILQGIQEILCQRGFAVFEVRKKRKGGIAGLVTGGRPILLSSDVQEALRFIGDLDEIDPLAVGIVGVGEAASTAAAVARQSETVAFLALIVDAPLESESSMVEDLRHIRAPILVLLGNGKSDESADTGRKALTQSLELSESDDYTVRIIELASADSFKDQEAAPEETGQLPTLRFISRWFQARF